MVVDRPNAIRVDVHPPLAIIDNCIISPTPFEKFVDDF
jgi:hypothetical protein